jgi:hypothetical protein
MLTRAKAGYFMPRRNFSLTAPATPISPLPSNYRTALKDPNWNNAMFEEFTALI